MLKAINPKLPMSNKAATKDFYINKLGFKNVGSSDYDGYLMVEKDNIEIHFFEFKEIKARENYSGVYIRTDNIEKRQIMIRIEEAKSRITKFLFSNLA